MHRKRLYALLALGILATLAGCSAEGSLSMEPVEDDERLAELASRSAGDIYHEDGQSVVRGAIDNETATANGTDPPIGTGLPFSVDGSYYNLDWEIVESDTEWRVGIGIDINATNVSGETISVAELPERDRQVVTRLLNEMEREQPEPEPGFEFGIGTRYTDAERSESVLLDPQEYDGVVYEGEVYPISVEEPRQITVNTYEYSATKVADDTEEYATHLREAYGFTLDSVSDGEQSILDEAANGSYYAENEDDEAFESLVDRFLEHNAVVRDEGSGKWLVRYNGTLYLARVDYSQFVDDDQQ